jgi:hypothetical protein
LLARPRPSEIGLNEKKKGKNALLKKYEDMLYRIMNTGEDGILR